MTEIKIKDIILVPISKVNPNPGNTNKHPPKQIDRLAHIIKTQGFRRPITISNQSGYIVSGHARYLAAKALGMEKVPVSYQDYATPELEFADMNADNAVAAWAEIDMAMVNANVAILDPSFDFSLLGFKDFVLDPAEKLDFENETQEQEKKYIIEVQFPNDCEMMDIHDDLVSRGYIVRIK